MSLNDILILTFENVERNWAAGQKRLCNGTKESNDNGNGGSKETGC